MNFTVSLSIVEQGRNRPKFDLNSDLNGEVTLAEFLEFTKASLIITADAVLKEEQALGFDPKPVVLVDGRPNKAPADVNPLGSISFVARQDMQDIIKDTFDGLIERSPILTGRYISSHLVFLNGNQVANGQNSLDAWLNTNPVFSERDLVRFVDIQPYARKLERLGVTADKRGKPQRERTRTVTTSRGFAVDGQKYRAKDKVLLNQPNGVYYLTARAIQAKYGKNVNIRFAFITGANMGLADLNQQHHFKGAGKGQGRTYLYPSITISVREAGILP